MFGNRNYDVSDYFFQPDSLRLRSTGFLLLKEFFDHEEFIHTRGFYTGEILTLSKNMNAPFYINQSKIVLFDNQNIVMCKISGSVADWLENMS